ncbi:AAA family ATPase [Candidatus Woesearchaeota archaeon]|jgi:gluconate kinase|nr:AAA family ATPase [Candidatus Woesearchaeota archaeon]MBT4321871.1 AAA family ATPase [Candidatus Woesearchaeota archaeon]MBT4630823.1 AAA family ATPase [Candidatus Woesearchaeota archaeon]
MKLIYIYGVPAVGKLTVAEQLAKITGFKLFHNHLTADYVSSLFPLRNDMSNKLKCEIAYKMFEAAAKNKVDLIFTMAHEEKYNDFLKNIIKIIGKFDGEVLFVRLCCKKEKLYDRVVSDSRKPFFKAKTIEEMDKIVKKLDKFETIPFGESLVIDNTGVSAKKCAQKIKEHYGL